VASAGDEEWVGGLGASEVISRDLDLASIRPPVQAVLDAVPIGEAAAAPVEAGGVVVTTRPTPELDPARGVQQRLVLITPDRERLAALVGLLAEGRLRTRVAATLPLAEAARAHQLVEAGGLRGKIVLIP
jgi:NADPH:quinone reductase-like Zn-dependent oxidoreductase